MSKNTIVSQLLCSRLCHDLAGVVGAINAGVELVDDAREQNQGSSSKTHEGEAFELISMSSQQVTYRLDFFRAAFGYKTANGALGTFKEMHSLVSKYLSYGNFKLDWRYGPGTSSDDELVNSIGPEGYQVTLLMLMIGAESLPREGAITLQVAVFPEGVDVGVESSGVGMRLREDVAKVMDKEFILKEDDDDLSSRNVHGYYAQLLACEFGEGIEISQEYDEMNQTKINETIQFATLIPKD